MSEYPLSVIRRYGSVWSNRSIGPIGHVDGFLAGASLVKLPRLFMVCLATLPTSILTIALLSPPSTPPPATRFSWQAATPRVGQAIGFWRVSSGFGPRIAPCNGCSTQHRGVDVAAPSGSPVYAVGDRNTSYEVTCQDDLIRQAMGRWSVEILHTSRCSPGRHQGGDLIGLSGTGGTGPHYHVQLRDENLYAKGQDGRVPPPAWVVRQLITGTPVITTK
jgi:murein DD-endopeptidase MepM/ murein hydrolase activator NlpD